jgi:tRNA threonylcarbamoyladenosine biosynthesis protein TsaE
MARVRNAKRAKPAKNLSHPVASGFSRTVNVTKIITTRSEEETAAIARELAETLSAGSVVLLFGDLGAGKTAFVRGLAEGLGVPREDVSSPTFTLIQEYRGGRQPLFHVDLYRIEDPREFEELGLDEIAEEGVLAIEWAERLPNPPPHAIRISIEHAGELQRRVTITNANC